MQEPDDIALLRQYTDHNSEEAFATLVSRHVDKVYSVALRHTRNPHQAEEITQAVFVILAKKANKLHQHTVLSGWLYQTARLTAVTRIRSEIRRARREQEAHMQNVLNEIESDVWPQIAPLLDAAMAGLSETDRHAVVLRFFDGKSMKQVGAALGASEDAAKMRLNRAVEKLRRFFTKRGVVLPTAVLTVAISANSVQAAPAMLAKTATTIAFARGATASTSTLTLIKGALKIMAWAKAKTAIVLGVAAILAAGTTAVIVTKLDQRPAPAGEENLSPEDVFLAQFNGYLGKVPKALFVRSTHFPLKNGVYSWRGGPLADAAGRNVEFTQLLTCAYDFKPARMVLPPNVPTTHFDFLATLPNCPNETFQAAVRNTLGWTAHTEMRETNVLLLKVKIADAPGLQAGVATNHSSRWIWGGAVYHVTNMPISDLREFLEDEIFYRPVLDQTGLTNKYDIILDWNAAHYPSLDYDSLKKVLLDHLGLELVPDRQRIEMLVVEQAKK